VPRHGRQRARRVRVLAGETAESTEVMRCPPIGSSGSERAYLERRIQEGKTKREALRSLKRHISRELYYRLTAIPLTS
jgi:hypothetical protein